MSTALSLGRMIAGVILIILGAGSLLFSLVQLIFLLCGGDVFFESAKGAAWGVAIGSLVFSLILLFVGIYLTRMPRPVMMSMPSSEVRITETKTVM